MSAWLFVLAACHSSSDTAHCCGAPDAAVDTAVDTPADACTPPAPVVNRRALAVIADFSDVQLEDWPGLGFRTVADIRAELDRMEAHWAFLSRGLETMRWDIIRVRLAQDATPGAFADFNTFRDEVVRLAKQQIHIPDYDIQGDGVIDTMWIIASNNGRELPYLVGGTSENEGAANFGDGQDSGSVIGRVTGNFNHEVGHTLGLVDTYGRYSTISDLSLMANSWPLPPNDFSAFERIRMGWVVPQVITQTTSNVVLPNAHEHLAAVKVPTVRPEEYFLIEYRKRPASGFGSATSFLFDGLAVYHVFEPSNMETDPPLIKLEPADGTTAPNLRPEPNDFAFPGNPVTPFVLHTYFGGDAVFAIDHLHFTADGALAFDVTILSDGAGSSPNLIGNPTFEAGTAGWITGGFQPQNAVFTFASIGANGSAHSISVSSIQPNDVEWSTQVFGTLPGRAYYMCGFIRGDSVTGGAGGTISISATFIQTPGLHGTFDFTQACAVETQTMTSASIACRMGGFAATTSGTIWCDDVSFQLLESAF